MVIKEEVREVKLEDCPPIHRTFKKGYGDYWPTRGVRVHGNPARPFYYTKEIHPGGKIVETWSWHPPGHGR